MTQEEFHKRYQYSPTKDCLGEGGFGKVFKAYDTHLDKWVAIKMAEVKPGLEQVRLKHEVEIVNKLPTHPNIAKYEECYTFSSFTGEYDFAVLQYYEYGNLQQLLETKQLTEQQKDSILRQILTGIEFLHNQGIIHRDLKPQNILIVNRNGEYIPKITDFGISKKLDANKSSVFTNSIAGWGTLAYASPEQLKGEPIKKNTDLWSFGVIVCQIYLGKLPFNTGSQSFTNEAGRNELYKQIAQGKLDSSVNQLPNLWLNVVKKCLVVDALARIENAAKCNDLLKGKESVGRIEKKDDDRTAFDSIENNTVYYSNSENIYLEYVYEELNSFYNGYARVKRNGKFGYINKNGQEVISCIYSDAYPFIDGIAATKLGQKWGIINNINQQIVPNRYDDIYLYEGAINEGLILVELNGKYGFINRYGKEVISCIYSTVVPFYEGLALVEYNKRWGFIDNNGFVKIPFDYLDAYSFSDGLAPVKKKTSRIFDDGSEKWGFIDKNGKKVVNFKFRSVFQGNNGFTKVSRLDYVIINDEGVFKSMSGTLGYINNNGVDIIKKSQNDLEALIYPQFVCSSYLDSDGFNDGLANVKCYNNKKYGYIDTNGKIVIECIYDEALAFKNGYARVKLNNKYGFINKSGKDVVKIKYDNANQFSDKLVALKLDEHWGFANSTGEIVIPFEYNDIEDFSDQVALVVLNGESFYINKNGKRQSFKL